MSDTVITVENLGKMYHIGLAAKRPQNLREALKRSVTAPFQYLTTHARHLRSDAAGTPPDQIWALKDVSFEVERGEVLGIIGRNGAGKSTLLKILSRITDPTEGRAVIRGRVNSLLEVGTGFHPELTGRENIRLNAALHGMRRAEINRQFDAIIAFSEVEKFLDTPVKRYSSGMYTRLAFAVAAHLSPDILIVDEVLAVGDAEFQRKCLGKMGEVSRSGRTVLFVSHNMGAVNQLCRACLWVDAGRIRRIGPSRTVIEEYLSSRTPVSLAGDVTLADDPQKSGQLKRVRLLTETGQVTTSFSCDSPLIVEMEFVIRRPIPGLYCWLDASRPDGTMVLVSDSFDSPPNPLDDLGVGVYGIRVTIPARTLGAGDYDLTLAFTGMLGGAASIDEPGVVARFHLSDSTSKRGNYRGGFLSTLARWEVRSQA
jgi:lipopolysaccharide transport system ATP-binding protein